MLIPLLVLAAGTGCADKDVPAREARPGATVAAAVATGSEAPDREAELRSAIAAFRTALNSGDSVAFFGLLAPELEVLAPGARPIRGDEARESFRPLFTGTRAEISPFTEEEITVSGDIAVQRHSFTLSTTPRAGGPTTASMGSGLHVWKRTPDGRWQIVKDIWTNPPDPAAGR
jgi:ketosteroid isomerase-like protein